MFITKNALLFCVFLLSRSSRSAWIEIGLAFLKTSAGAIAIIAFLIFVMPFAVSVVGTLIEEIRKEFRR